MATTQATRPNGRLLRQLRTERGWNAHVLARIARVGVHAILMYERFDLPPKSYATREKIARALGVDPAELFGDDPQEVRVP